MTVSAVQEQSASTRRAEVPASGGSTRTDVGAFFAAALILAGQLPLLLLHGRHLWERPHYRFFPVLLAGVAWLAYRRWPLGVSRPARLPVVWWTTAGVGLASAVVLFSPWLAAASWIISAAALIRTFGGRPAWRTLFSTWLLLWFLVPPPFGLDLRAIQGLQAFTSRSASMVLDVFGIHHLMAGNVLELPGKRLMVNEACSGVQSLLVMLSMTGLFAVWARRSWLRGGLLLAAAVLWSGLTNVARVVAIAVGWQTAELDLTTGWPHQVLGLVAFTLLVAMLASTDRLLCFLFDPIPPDPAQGERPHRRLVRWWNRLVGAKADDSPLLADRNDPSTDPLPADEPSAGPSSSGASNAPQRWPVWGLAVLFVAAGAVEVWSMSRRGPVQQPIARFVEHLDEDWFPLEDQQWRRVDFHTVTRERTSDEGQFSRMWVYQAPFCPVTVSLDYPFIGWHELTRCYRGQGWTVAERRIHAGPNAKTGPEAEPAFVEVQLRRPSGEYGYLFFSLFTSDGKPLEPPEGAGALRRGLAERVIRRLAQWGWDASTYQVQLFAATDFPLSDVQRDALRAKFFAYRARVGELWQSQEARR